MNALALAIIEPAPTRTLQLMPPPTPPRRPTSPELHGIAAGIDEVLVQQEATRRSVKELSGNVGSLEARVVHHGVEIIDLKEAHQELRAVVDEQGDRLDEHNETLTEQKDRLEELARLRHAPMMTGHRTAPTAELVVASTKVPSIPPEELASIGTASPSGTWTLNQDMIFSAIAGLRQQIEGLENARAVEVKLKEQAEKAAEKAAAKAKEETAAADARSARLRGWLTLTLGIIIALGSTFIYLAPRLGAPPPVTTPAR